MPFRPLFGADGATGEGAGAARQDVDSEEAQHFRQAASTHQRGGQSAHGQSHWGGRHHHVRAATALHGRHGCTRVVCTRDGRALRVSRAPPVLT